MFDKLWNCPLNVPVIGKQETATGKQKQNLFNSNWEKRNPSGSTAHMRKTAACFVEAVQNKCIYSNKYVVNANVMSSNDHPSYKHYNSRLSRSRPIAYVWQQ